MRPDLGALADQRDVEMGDVPPAAATSPAAWLRKRWEEAPRQVGSHGGKCCRYRRRRSRRARRRSGHGGPTSASEWPIEPLAVPPRCRRGKHDRRGRRRARRTLGRSGYRRGRWRERSARGQIIRRRHLEIVLAAVDQRTEAQPARPRRRRRTARARQPGDGPPDGVEAKSLGRLRPPQRASGRAFQRSSGRGRASPCRGRQRRDGARLLVERRHDAVDQRVRR